MQDIKVQMTCIWKLHFLVSNTGKSNMMPTKVKKMALQSHPEFSMQCSAAYTKPSGVARW